MHFNATPESIVDHARHLFVSEDFSSSIAILRESFPDAKEVTDKTIISLLRGDIGIKSTSEGEVDISDEFVDLEYQQLAKEVLDNYNFLIMINDKAFQVSHYYTFDLRTVYSKNELILELTNNTGKLVDLSASSYVDSIRKIENEHDSFHDYLSNNHFATFVNKKIYFFNSYDKPLFDEICTFHDTHLDAISAYDIAECN
jgi:hypothetical protein